MGSLASIQNGVRGTVVDGADGIAGPAPCVESYLGVWASDATGLDPHPVHGLQAQDGGFVAVGFSVEKETSPEKDGFLVKTKGTCTHNYSAVFQPLDPNGSGCEAPEWIYKFSGAENTFQQLLWVAESLDGTYYIVVGLEEVNSASVIVISKINATDGTLVWKMNKAGSSNNASAETVAFTSDGGFVIGGSLNNPEPIKTMYFKSAGQVAEGSPFIAKVSAADAAGTSAPSSFEWEYEVTPDSDSSPYQGAAKALRVDSSDNIYAILGVKGAVVKLNSAGAEQFKSQALQDGVQLNDLEVVSDGIVLTGHRYVTYTDNENCNDTCGTILGFLIKVDSTAENTLWTHDFGNYIGGVNQFAGIDT